MDSIKDFFYKYFSGPLALLLCVAIFYLWWFEGYSFLLLGFIPITPLLVLLFLGCGIYFIKLGYIDGDLESIKNFWNDKS